MKNRDLTSITVRQLADKIGAELVGDGLGHISGINTVEAADMNEVTFISGEKYIGKLRNSRAGAIITSKKINDLQKTQLIVENVEAGLIKALSIFAPKLAPVEPGIDSRAIVSETAKVSGSAYIGPDTYINRYVEIGEGSIIAAGCKIGENTKVGENCRLDSNVVIYHNCIIGNNVIIQANSTIGSTGFGYSHIDGAHQLIPHNGGVIIEDCVEIGANCCIDRAKFGNTIIGAGTKIDNLVQIAHNVVVGKCCLIAGLVGLAGSCKLGDGVILAGQVGLVDHIEVGDGVIAGARTAIFQDIPAGQQILGVPAIERKNALRMMKAIPRLPKIIDQIRQLSARIKKLENSHKD
jgi:UDP-3-O-[3-hydroxymyristoyl] glucosamine N-acyltransferase